MCNTTLEYILFQKHAITLLLLTSNQSPLLIGFLTNQAKISLSVYFIKRHNTEKEKEPSTLTGDTFLHIL